MKYTIRTLEEKHALLEEWRASGLPMTTFARERGLVRTNLRNWLDHEEGRVRRQWDEVALGVDELRTPRRRGVRQLLHPPVTSQALGPSGRPRTVNP